MEDLTGTGEEVELLNINVEDIEFGDRARKQYSGLQSLANDFKKQGIITPITVMRQKEGKPFLILAGGRRYSAAVLGNFSSLPARIYPADLSPLQRREIELAENMKDFRRGLEPREEAWLIEEIHQLNVAKYGTAHGSSEGHSAADTARILGVSAMTVSRNLQIASGMRRFGEDIVTSAGTQAEALQALKRAERREEDQKVIKSLDVQLANDSAGVKRRLINGYIVGDFFTYIQDIPDKMVNFIELDPPFSIDLKNIKATQREDSLKEYNEIKQEDYPKWIRAVLRECYRVMLPLGWIVCWHGVQWTREIIEALIEVGFEPRVIPGIWFKTNTSGQTHHPEISLGSVYEPFLYARKDTATIRKMGMKNVFPYNVVFQDKKIHPTEKPIEMLQDILEIFAPSQSHILVPFLGSGNTLLAAANLGMTGFGFDLSSEYKAAYTRRVVDSSGTGFKSYST